MEVHSLGYRTDLFFPRFDGLIEDRGAYLVIRTPSNPGFYWGNFLLFSDPPTAGDPERWQALFDQEIAIKQPTHHTVFAWDSVDGDSGEVQPFLDAGFLLAENVVLAAEEVNPPPKYNSEVVVRPLLEDWEWEAAYQLQMDCREPIHQEAPYAAYLRAKFTRYRDMQRAGLGHWFGAFLEERMAADLGLFCMDGIGRFQSVETHPEFRRQGICGTLVYYAAQYGLEQMGARTLVMLADEHYHAARIYESVGFRPVERQRGLERW